MQSSDRLTCHTATVRNHIMIFCLPSEKGGGNGGGGGRTGRKRGGSKTKDERGRRKDKGEIILIFILLKTGSLLVTPTATTLDTKPNEADTLERFR